MLVGPVRLALKIVGLVVAGLLVYFAVTLVQVWLTSRHYDPRKAQAIVVMGAAQYDGVPSPDLRARLDEALLLYNHGHGNAPLIAVTGSKERGDQFTEAESGARYLEDHGVPPSAIVEAGGDDSWMNLADVVPELRRRGVHSVLVVTEPFHEDRSMAIASDMGLEPFPTPTRSSPISGWSTVPYFLKEGFGVALGRVIGFQNLHALG